IADLPFGLEPTHDHRQRDGERLIQMKLKLEGVTLLHWKLVGSRFLFNVEIKADAELAQVMNVQAMRTLARDADKKGKGRKNVRSFDPTAFLARVLFHRRSHSLLGRLSSDVETADFSIVSIFDFNAVIELCAVEVASPS